jgi:hypothetical protein
MTKLELRITDRFAVCGIQDLACDGTPIPGLGAGARLLTGEQESQEE